MEEFKPVDLSKAEVAPLPDEALGLLAQVWDRVRGFLLASKGPQADVMIFEFHNYGH